MKELPPFNPAALRVWKYDDMTVYVYSIPEQNLHLLLARNPGYGYATEAVGAKGACPDPREIMLRPHIQWYYHILTLIDRSMHMFRNHFAFMLDLTDDFFEAPVLGKTKEQVYLDTFFDSL